MHPLEASDSALNPTNSAITVCRTDSCGCFTSLAGGILSLVGSRAVLEASSKLKITIGMHFGLLVYFRVWYSFHI